ncbi:hypothetical protein BJY00DRAFT_157666 [Aspergillus carlsbadensis]|nr:hypothetical protein BJY00DRAFT_157666 [Aspergillus carlsbadensis]
MHIHANNKRAILLNNYHHHLGSGDGRTLLFRLYGTLSLARSRHLSRGSRSLRNFALKPIPANLPRITILSLLCFLDKHRGSFPQIRAEVSKSPASPPVTYFADIRGSPDSYYSFCHLINAQGNTRLICCCYYNHPSSSRFFAAAIASRRLSLIRFLFSPSFCSSPDPLLLLPLPVFTFFFRPHSRSVFLLLRQSHSPAVHTPSIHQTVLIYGTQSIQFPPPPVTNRPLRHLVSPATLSGSSLRDS